MDDTQHQDPRDPFKFDYDSYNGLIDKKKPIDPRVNEAWRILIKVTENFRENIREIFSVLNDSIGSQVLDTSSQGGNRVNFFESIEERLNYLHTLKAIITSNCSFIQHYEEGLTSSSQTDSSGKEKNKKSKVNHDPVQKEYDRNKERVMKNLLQLIVIPLNKITDSPTEAKDIVGNVMQVAYKMIENCAVNNLNKNKDLYDIVLSIIGFGIEKYDQSLSFCLKLIQILQYKEQSANMMAEVVEFIVTRHNQRLLIKEVMCEIDRIDLSKDSSYSKAVCNFLTALSERCPREFIPSLDHIFQYLDQDPYSLRSASLTVMANLHIKYLKDSEVDSEIELRVEILDSILTHIRDVAIFTRSKALTSWSEICENNCLPLSYVIPVTKAAVNRLRDKSFLVRKNAARFLVHMIHRNPYYKKLPLETFMVHFHEAKATYERLLAEEKKKLATDEEVETLSQHSTQDESINENEPDSVNPNVSTRTLVQPGETPVEASRRKLEYFQAGSEFIKEIHRAIPLMLVLLSSKTNSDIQEAIDFFVTCHEHGIQEALLGFKRMILLINTTEKSIKDKALAAYRAIFFNPDLKEARIVSNLLNFIESATIGEFISIEILIGLFAANGDITKSMERELFATFSKKKPDVTNEESIAAIQLIGMLATTKPEIVRHNLLVCIQYGLAVTNYDEQESRLARETCIAIKKSLPKKIEDRQKRALRLSKDDELFVKLEDILVGSLLSMNFEHWFSFCDEALKIIFEMAENPDKICESIYVRLSDELLKNSVQCTSTLTQENNTNRNESPDFVFQPSATATTNGTTSSSQSTQSNTNMEMVHPIALARFIHFLGDVALNLTVFLELPVLLEVKIRNALSSNDATKNNNSGQNITVNNISISSRRRSERFGANKSVDDQNLEEEIGLAGAEAEDMEMEFIGGICDDEIVCGNNLLATAARLIVEVVTDPGRYPQRELKLASALALAKFMMVSVKFCEKYLRLLFTILERTNDSGVKINLLVAISDLCVRFPNQLDGWTSKIFECLKSEDVLVRRTALKLTSRLVLCDVMKPKEQISAIANLIVDDDEQIAQFSRHFFLELSKKLNAIYNVLPDIISRLSSGASEANFRIVMRFIFELIDKSQHVERLIDKLCTRFQETDNERHWADLAYCLSLLKHTDRTMSKLIDKYDCYKDKLCIDSVRESLISAVATYKKTPGLKNETKQILDDFEKKLTQSAKVGLDDEEMNENGVEADDDETDTEVGMDVQEDE